MSRRKASQSRSRAILFFTAFIFLLWAHGWMDGRNAAGWRSTCRLTMPGTPSNHPSLAMPKPKPFFFCPFRLLALAWAWLHPANGGVDGAWKGGGRGAAFLVWRVMERDKLTRSMPKVTWEREGREDNRFKIQMMDCQMSSGGGGEVRQRKGTEPEADSFFISTFSFCLRRYAALSTPKRRQTGARTTTRQTQRNATQQGKAGQGKARHRGQNG